MKLWIYMDEWWPVATLVPKGTITRTYNGEFTDDEIARIRRLGAEFTEVQKMIYSKCNAAVDLEHLRFELIDLDDDA